MTYGQKRDSTGNSECASEAGYVRRMFKAVGTSGSGGTVITDG